MLRADSIPMFSMLRVSVPAKCGLSTTFSISNSGLVGDSGSQWPNQGLPDDGTLATIPGGVTVSSVASIDVR